MRKPALKKAALTTARKKATRKPKPKPPRLVAPKRSAQDWAEYWHGKGDRPHGDAPWIRDGGWSGKR